MQFKWAIFASQILVITFGFVAPVQAAALIESNATVGPVTVDMKLNELELVVGYPAEFHISLRSGQPFDNYRVTTRFSSYLTYIESFRRQCQEGTTPVCEDIPLEPTRFGTWAVWNLDQSSFSSSGWATIIVRVHVSESAPTPARVRSLVEFVAGPYTVMAASDNDFKAPRREVIISSPLQSPLNLAPGQFFYYSVYVRNTGNLPLYDPVFMTYYPEELFCIRADYWVPWGFTSVREPGIMSWKGFQPLWPGASAEFRVNTRVSDGAEPGRTGELTLLVTGTDGKVPFVNQTTSTLTIQQPQSPPTPAPSSTGSPRVYVPMLARASAGC